MKLYLIHCGFYDSEIGDGVYESHINLFRAARNIEEAKKGVRQNPTFQKKRMHIDGLQEIEVVDGYKVAMTEEPSLSGESKIISNLYRDL